MNVLDTSPDRRRMGVILACGAAAALSLVIISVVVSLQTPTIGIAGATSTRAIRPEDFGKRQIESTAIRWLLTWSNSNSYNFLPHAALCMPDVDENLAPAMRTYFRDQARLFDALDRTTTAHVKSVEATQLDEGLWRVTYTLEEHDFYGPVDTGNHEVAGQLVITTATTGSAPALIIKFDPKT